MNQSAYVLRENTGTSQVMETAQAAATGLADFDIPHLIVGGIALQEHGYPRVTTDVDIIVPDVLEAVEFLTANLSGPFRRVPGLQNRAQHRYNGIFVDLLPAGCVVKQGCKVPFPQPRKITGELQLVSLEQLISLKLDSWTGSPGKRLRDKADVTELILRRNLPRDLAVAPSVQEQYIEIWDTLQA